MPGAHHVAFPALLFLSLAECKGGQHVVLHDLFLFFQNHISGGEGGMMYKRDVLEPPMLPPPHGTSPFDRGFILAWVYSIQTSSLPLKYTPPHP